MKKILLLSSLLFAIPIIAQSYLSYDAERRVPFQNAAIYARDEYHWFIKNTGQPSRLFLNGVYQSQEGGPSDLNMLAAWSIQPNATGVKVAIVDLNTAHGQRMVECVRLIAPGANVNLVPISRYYPDAVAIGINTAVAEGNQIIVIATGFASPETLVLVAIQSATNCVFVCSVPNADQNIDVQPDYPTSWNLTNVLGVTSTDRTGNLDYGYAAWGTNVVAAPGRNIVANGTYSTGTSYAAPITAGTVALLAAKKPGRLTSFYVQHIRKWTTPITLSRRIEPYQMLLNLRTKE